MEITVFLLLFVALVVAVTMVILIVGYRGVEEGADARAGGARRVHRHRGGFFEPLALPGAREGGSVEDLEERVRRERGVAAAFVSDPGAQTLYLRTNGAMDALVAGLEQHLARERSLVAAFAANPSLQRLFPGPCDVFGAGASAPEAQPRWTATGN